MKDAPWRKEERYSYVKEHYTASRPFYFTKKQIPDYLFGGFLKTPDAIVFIVILDTLKINLLVELVEPVNLWKTVFRLKMVRR
jgi:hypothetical protein